jgi:polyhydroxybutyrate depolymerase
MTMIRQSLAALLIALHAAAWAGGAVVRTVNTVSVGGTERTYILRIPAKVNAAKPAPLVIVLHGWTASGELAEIYTKMAEKADEAGFIVAFPNGTAPGKALGWNTGFLNLGKSGVDDFAFMETLVKDISAKAKVDPKQVYLCGHSNGAMMSHAAGSKLSRLFAAIGVVAGTIGLDQAKPPILMPQPQGPVSVIIVHGQKDPTVGYDHSAKALLVGVSAPDSASFWAKANGCQGPKTLLDDANAKIELWSKGRAGTEVKLVTVKNGTHDWPGGVSRSGPETTSKVNAADLLWDFFSKHRKP